MHDPINPSHYTTGAIECIEAIEASMTPEAFKGFLKGNCMKYLFRYEKKNGLEDLKKCEWYLNHLIATVEVQATTEKAIEKESADVRHTPAWVPLEEIFGTVNHDPDDYMARSCPDGFCPIPSVRQGPPEDLFEAVN
jgi:hypothetical protein